MPVESRHRPSEGGRHEYHTPTNIFEFHLNKKHMAGAVPDDFDKWVIYIDGACKNNSVAANVHAGWGAAIFVSRGGVET